MKWIETSKKSNANQIEKQRNRENIIPTRRFIFVYILFVYVCILYDMLKLNVISNSLNLCGPGKKDWLKKAKCITNGRKL